MTTKVLYVFGGEKASGAEIVIQRLIDFNLREVTPHLFLSPGKFADDLIASGKPYPITTIDRLRKLNRSSSSAFRFFTEAIQNYLQISSIVLKYIRKNNIKIVHANTVVPASYLIPAIIYSFLFNRGVRWIWSDHDLQYFSKIDILFSKVCSSLYNTTLAVSEAVKRKYGSKKSVFVLYNGLDVTVYKWNAADRADFRKQHAFTDGQVVVSIAGVISPRKGQLQLITVFKQLAIKYNHIQLVIAGFFGADDENYNTAVKNGIYGDSHIVYLGHVTHMRQLYCGSDVIVNNSNLDGSEPLGTTIYEAMACESVVIASNTGGTAEIITNEVDGFVFEAENEDKLMKTLEFVIMNAGSLNQIRNMARKKAAEKFAVEAMAANYNCFVLNNLKPSKVST